MQFGYVLCNQNRSKILTLTKDKQVRMITSNKENIENTLKFNENTRFPRVSCGPGVA